MSLTTDVRQQRSHTEIVTSGMPLTMVALTTIVDRALGARLLTACAESTGGYVVLAPEFRYVPSLVGGDGRPVALYEFLEAVDGITDYDEITEMFPLSYGQIAGAFSFLRRLAMTNPVGWDADEEEAAEEASDPAFIESLRRAFNDRETIRVFDAE